MLVVGSEIPVNLSLISIMLLYLICDKRWCCLSGGILTMLHAKLLRRPRSLCGETLQHYSHCGLSVHFIMIRGTFV